MKVAIGGEAMSTIQGSELYYSAERYDGGSEGARQAVTALQCASSRRIGRWGRLYTIEVAEPGALAIAAYCRKVGETFTQDSESRAEGRALLAVADRITALLAASSCETAVR